MLEAVGHEFMEAFFGCCESVLAEDGLLVLQVMIGWKQESLCPLSFPV
jgi:cyclopropane fatty-acyl-phospholipid synthase-like methyltransferase